MRQGYDEPRCVVTSGNMPRHGCTRVGTHGGMGTEGTIVGDDGMHRPIPVSDSAEHLAQLVQSSRTLDLREGPLWVDSGQAQSPSLLAGVENVIYMPNVDSRDWRAAFRVLPRALRVLRRAEQVVVSTRVAVAVPMFLAAWSERIRRVFAMGVSRSAGPAQPGWVVSWFPGARSFCQYAEWVDGRRNLVPSGPDDLTPSPMSGLDHRPVRVLVTFGTIGHYRSERLVDLAPEGVSDQLEILRQSGAAELPGEVRETLILEEVDRSIRKADVVMSHAGAGSVVSISPLEKIPVLVPRLAEHREHIDDLQLQIIEELGGWGPAVPVGPQEPLTASVVDMARSTAVTSASVLIL